DGKQQTLSEKTKMPRDGAKVRRCSRKASTKRSTIKCVRHAGRRRIATNQSHNARTRAVVISVISPIPRPAQPTRRGGRMLSELAPVVATILSFIPGMKVCVLLSTFHFHIQHAGGLSFRSRASRGLTTPP